MVNKNIVLGSIAVVGLAVIVLMGWAVIEGFSETFRDTSGLTNATVTLGAVNISTAVGTTSQYGYLQTLPECTNDTEDILQDEGYTWTKGNADGGTITLLDANSTWAGDQVNCTMTYLQDSSLQAQADKFSSGLAIFGSFIGVVILAILGKLILSMFSRKKEEGD